MISSGVDKIKNITLFISYTSICIMVLFISDLFATPSVFEGMKEVEAIGKPASTEFIQRPTITYKAEGLRDPFESYIAEEASPSGAIERGPAVFQNHEAEKSLPSLTVQGLVWGGNFPQAIINNKVLKIGDTIEGARIKGIEKDAVTLIFEGREYKLPVAISNSGPQNKSIPLGGKYEKKF